MRRALLNSLVEEIRSVTRPHRLHILPWRGAKHFPHEVPVCVRELPHHTCQGYLLRDFENQLGSYQLVVGDSWCNLRCCARNVGEY